MLSTLTNLLALSAIAGAALYFLPLARENATTACDAYVSLELKLSPPGDPLAAALVRNVGGSIFEAEVRQRRPDVAPRVVCTEMYWRAVYVGAAEVRRVEP